MGSVICNESDVRVEYFTGVAGVAMDVTVSSTSDWRLMHVRLHLSGASGAENFIVQIDSATAAVHDTVLLTRPMNGLSDDTFSPGDGSDGIWLKEDDEVDFTYPNATAQISWGLEVIYRSVGS